MAARKVWSEICKIIDLSSALRAVPWYFLVVRELEFSSISRRESSETQVSLCGEITVTISSLSHLFVVHISLSYARDNDDDDNFPRHTMAKVLMHTSLQREGASYLIVVRTVIVHDYTFL
jgi:hypothetical protein